MKYINKIFTFFLLVLVMSSCKKEDNKVVFENGTAPVVSADVTGNIALVKANKDNHAVSFTWTNPNYQLNTGVSSQDVSYALQLDTTGGSNFLTVSTSKADLTHSYTQGEFNKFLIDPAGSGLFLTPDSTYTVRARIKSFLGGELATNPTNQYSNVLTFTVKPYSEDPDLWITGTAVTSGYTNTPPPAQKFSYDRLSSTFYITLPFVSGQEYKLLTVSGQWQPQWGGAPATGGTLSVNDGTGSDPNAIPTPADAGNYKLTVSLINKTITVVKQ